MSIVQMRMQALGLELVSRATPPASVCQYKIIGNVLHIGEVSSLDGRPEGLRGRVGQELDIAGAHREAQAAGLRLAAVALAVCGDEQLVQVLRMRAIIRCARGFADLDKVADGISDVLTDCFGARGRHARTVIGAGALQAGAPIVCCAEIEVRNAHA